MNDTDTRSAAPSFNGAQGVTVSVLAFPVAPDGRVDTEPGVKQVFVV